MQGWGENNSPRRFGLLGQAVPGPALPSGPVLAQKGILGFWAKVGPIYFGPRSAQFILGRDRPNLFWAEIGPTPLELRPAQLVGPAQHSPI